MPDHLPSWFVESWVRCRLRVHGVGLTTGVQGRPQMHTREHWLLVACVTGSMTADFADAGWTLVAGDACLVPPQTSFRVSAADAGSSYAQAHLNLGLLDGGTSPLVSLGLPAVVGLAGRPEVAGWFQALLGCSSDFSFTDDAARLRANALTELVVLTFVEEGLSSGDLVAAPGAPSWIWDLVRLVRQRPGRPELEVRWIATELGLTPDHVARSVRRHLGTTVVGLVRRERMRVARDLLSNQPELDVRRVAERCGYRDPSHFARDFRREAGVSAREWRRALSVPASCHATAIGHPGPP